MLLPAMLAKRREKPPVEKLEAIPSGKIAITWLGHAAFLLRTAEHSVLIDPVWTKWLKIVKRLSSPVLTPRDLPKIDLVLITHAHFDHLDKRSLRKLPDMPPIVVPWHVGTVVSSLGFERIHEMHTWDTLRHGHLRVTLTPARHWGARVLHDTHRGYGGFLVEYNDRCVFHCGDSSYFDGFVEIGERCRISAALLPIGAYDTPSHRDVHMNPEEALQAFQDLRADTMIPMHYGSFRLGYEPMDEPLHRLEACATHLGLRDRVHALAEGATFIV